MSNTGEVAGRLVMECGCSVERVSTRDGLAQAGDSGVLSCERHGWTALIEVRDIRPVRRISPRGGCIAKRVFLACRCRYHEFTPALPGSVAVCEDHGEQRVISAKPHGERHGWGFEDPFTGWLVCRGCGRRNAGTHDGQMVEAEVHYDCGCVSRHPQIPERYLAQFAQKCREHGDGKFQGRGWRTRVERLSVIDPDWCTCGRCMDRRREEQR